MYTDGIYLIYCKRKSGWGEKMVACNIMGMGEIKFMKILLYVDLGGWVN